MSNVYQALISSQYVFLSYIQCLGLHVGFADFEWILFLYRDFGCLQTLDDDPSVKIKSLLSSRHPELYHNTCCVHTQVYLLRLMKSLLLYKRSAVGLSLLRSTPRPVLFPPQHSESEWAYFHISLSAFHLFGASLFISFPLPRAGRWAVMNGSAGHTFFDPVTHWSRGGGRGLLQHPQATGWSGLWTTFEISNYPCDISPNKGSHHSEQLTVLQSWAFSSKLHLQMHWQTWSIYSVQQNSWILIVFCRANSHVDVE